MRGGFPGVNDTLLRLLEAPGLRERSDRVCVTLRQQIVREGGGLFRLMPLCSFFDAGEAAAIAEAASGLARLQTRIMGDLLAASGREGLLERFDVPVAMRRFVNWEELCEPRYLIGRFDFLACLQGYKFCEFNVDSCVGGAEMFDMAAGYFRGIGVELDGDPRAPLRDLAELIAETAARHQARDIVLLDWSVGGGSGGKGYFDFYRMRDYVAEAANLAVHIADERSFDPAWLVPGRAEQVFVHRAFMLEEMDDEGAFLDRLLRAGCPVYGTYETEIRTDKLWFALFHDADIQAGLSDAERALVAGFVPYTSAVSAEVLDRLIAAKGGLIFKPRLAYGGNGILVGAETDARVLREALLAGGLKSWVAQEMVEGVLVSFPQEPGGMVEPNEIVFGLYVYGTRHNGMLLRGSTISKIVNATSGAAGINWSVCMDAARRGRIEADLHRHWG